MNSPALRPLPSKLRWCDLVGDIGHIQHPTPPYEPPLGQGIDFIPLRNKVERVHPPWVPVCHVHKVRLGFPGTLGEIPYDRKLWPILIPFLYIPASRYELA